MVVARKRNDNKGVKRSSLSSLPGNGKTHHQEKQIESLENSSVKKVWAGPSIVKESDGKRKAHYDLNIGPTLSASLLDEQLTNFASGLVAMGLGQNHLESKGRASKELNKRKPKTNSVKGKKEVARNKASLPNPIIVALDKASPTLAASDKTSFSTPIDWSTSISKLRTELNREFKFSAKLDNKMPNKMEVAISTNTIEYSLGILVIDSFGLGSDGRTMVEIPLQRTRGGRNEQAGSDTMRNNIGGELDCEEDVGKSGNCDNLYGQSACNETFASVSTHHRIQYSPD